MSTMDVFDEIVKSVVQPVVDRYATGPTRNVIASDIATAKKLFRENLNGLRQKWTWRKLKKAILKGIFSWVSVQNMFLDSHVKQHGGNMMDEATTVGGIGMAEASNTSITRPCSLPMK